MHKLGIRKLPYDPRDFDFHKTFGSVEPEALPPEFTVAAPLVIKDQDIPSPSDMCTAFAATEVDEDIDAVEMSPEYQFAKEKQILGDPTAYGSDLRTPMKVGVQYGFLPQRLAPFTLAEKGRDFVANFANWPTGNFDMMAASYKKKSFFSVQPTTDLFDGIRSAMYLNRVSRQSVLTGSNWYAEWTGAVGGVIPEVYSENVAQHCFKIFGWKQINGEPYLIMQNSEGTDSGDNGLFYFPRSVANKEFTFGTFCFAAVGSYSPQPINSFLAWIFNLIKRIF